MKSALIISTFLAAASLALAIPYDWDPFMLDVTTTVAGVQKQREAVIKDIDEHPLLRQKHLEQVDQMIDDIIRIQDMIDIEFEYINELTKDQRALVEKYKNLTLRIHQELSDLRKKI